MPEKQQGDIQEKGNNFIIQETEKILKESGALEVLRKIQKGMLGDGLEKHQLSYVPDTGSAILVWGNGFNVITILDESTGIKTLHASGEVGCNFSAIQVSVNLDKKELHISGKDTYKLGKNDWKDSKKVNVALAKVYTDPAKVLYSEPFDGMVNMN